MKHLDGLFIATVAVALVATAWAIFLAVRLTSYTPMISGVAAGWMWGLVNYGRLVRSLEDRP